LGYLSALIVSVVIMQESTDNLNKDKLIKNGIGNGYMKELINFLGIDDTLVEDLNLAIERGIYNKPFSFILTKSDEMALFLMTDETVNTRYNHQLL
jgi:hypothetical protein